LSSDEVIFGMSVSLSPVMAVLPMPAVAASIA